MDDNTQPIVVQAPGRTRPSKSPIVAWLPKFFFIALGAIIFVELVIGVKVLIAPTAVLGDVATLSPGKVALIIPKTTFAVNEAVPVEIRVYTGGHALSGTDISLRFDPKALDVAPQSFVAGNVYAEYPIITIDRNTGTVKISGIASPGTAGINGIDVFGFVNFTAKQAGSTTVTLEYSPSTTTKTNLIESLTTQNVLGSGAQVSLTVSNTPTKNTLKTTCSPLVHQICRDSSGRVGSYWCGGLNDPDSCTIGCFQNQTGSVRGCKISNLSAQ